MTMRDKVRNRTIFFLSRAHDFGQTLWAPHVDLYRRPGAIPKDVPSAGVTLVAALGSLFERPSNTSRYGHDR
jgi:ATP-dependent Lon protease